MLLLSHAEHELELAQLRLERAFTRDLRALLAVQPAVPVVADLHDPPPSALHGMDAVVYVTPGDEARVPSTQISTGLVMAQVPDPETPAVPQSRVHRLVSTGPEIPVYVMPDLGGLDRDVAETWLTRNGLRRGAVRRVSMSGRRPGQVVGQLPRPGYPVRSNDVIDLTVAQ